MKSFPTKGDSKCKGPGVGKTGQVWEPKGGWRRRGEKKRERVAGCGGACFRFQKQ